jgi:hypothetical protein
MKTLPEHEQGIVNRVACPACSAQPAVYDVQRADANYAGQGAVTQDYPIVFQGAKVLAK